MPVGPDPDRWRTFPGERTVVVVARTVTSTVRVLDVLGPVFRDDPRVDLVFAFDPTSAFNDGVHDLARTVGARILPWHQFPHLAPDLIITASENADLVVEGHTAPVLVLPHGVGFHKVVPDSRSDQDRLAGVVPDALLRSGRARIAVSHPDQAAQLAAAHPSTAGCTLLVGDPCHDMLINGQELRDTYRAALGVRGDRRLIMLSSTWRDRSLLGRDPSLPARLLAELPMDEYAVALVTHPNIVAAHGTYQLRSVLSSALDAGLLRIPPTDGWQATLLASDLLIGDHGSVTFYGAALGKPLLLGAFGGDEAVPDTPMAELGRLAPLLAADVPLRPQIERTLADAAPDSKGANPLTALGDRALVPPGYALHRLRTAVYDLLRLALPEPLSPLPRLAPDDPLPADQQPDVTAVFVTTQVSDTPAGPQVTVRRAPAVVAHFTTANDATMDGTITDVASSGEPDGADGTFRHLSCSDRERDRRLPESASVLVCETPAATTVAADRWATATLSRYPGCRIAAAEINGGGCRIRLHDGRSVDVSATGGMSDAAVLAATVYALLRSGHPLTNDTVVIRVGARTGDADLRLVRRTA
ncbi:CDP-glycerol glycerophosphotransferase family protein [Streptomyces pinistramenti]|uniref:CDP-glycerol glycerophosphotransferase family protein n=1 Tax=Streptomyces pinistramenti TaxID=2884812 RepID=UPI001D07C988|nr:CDP-glycerol glycerophosphotransferase family protein [Streptomyces pinistramenti]MCB5907209.1 CDP-glycerol glycerophosphotransferase family protein [Streptomyces pinistramenti]